MRAVRSGHLRARRLLLVVALVGVCAGACASPAPASFPTFSANYVDPCYFPESSRWSPFCGLKPGEGGYTPSSQPDSGPGAGGTWLLGGVLLAGGVLLGGGLTALGVYIGRGRRR